MNRTHPYRSRLLVCVALTALLTACPGSKPELTLSITKPSADLTTNTNVPVTLEIPGRTLDQFTALNVVFERKRASDPDASYAPIATFDRTSKYPFTSTWDVKAETDGSYALRAKATYTGGGFSSDTFTTTSDPRKIALDRRAPTVALAGSASVTSETPLKLTATVTTAIDPAANNPSSAITKVELYDGAKKLDEKTVSPYVFEVKFTKDNNGPKAFKARAYDQVGAVGESSVLAVDVKIPVPDVTPPTVVSVDPPNGATGKYNTQPITVTFSEPMNQVATQAAYQSADLPASAVTFTWGTDGKVMTVKPNAPLEYKVVPSPNDAARSYSFALTSTATDLAGNKLAGLNSSFSTLKQVTMVISSVDALTGSAAGGATSFACPDICVGDAVENLGLRGFVTFSLFSLPSDLSVENIVDANLNFAYKSISGEIACRSFDSSQQTIRINDFFIESVSFNTLNNNIYELQTNNLVYKQDYTGDIIFCDKNITWYPNNTVNNKVNTLAAVKKDWENRKSRNSLSQYRFRFGLQTDVNGKADYIDFVKSGSGAPRLEITYLIP